MKIKKAIPFPLITFSVYVICRTTSDDGKLVKTKSTAIDWSFFLTAALTFIFNLASLWFSSMDGDSSLLSFLSDFLSFFFCCYCASWSGSLIWGPAPVMSNNGARYYIHFTDAFSKFSWRHMKEKEEVPSVSNYKCQISFLIPWKSYKLMMVEMSTNRSCASFPTFWIALPAPPELNGLAEGKHRHIVELGLSIMSHASIPLDFWNDILGSVVNRWPSFYLSFLVGQPYHQFGNSPPNYTFLGVIGCLCFLNTRP